MYDEAICAIATAYGVGSISIIRCSGENVLSLVNKVFKGRDLTKVKPNTIHYGYIHENGEVLDEVLVSVFHGPKSFTGENSCEINCHGGIYNTNRVLEALLSHGFRLAQPGEFSKRAFLNGRIDLTQAESIMDIISSSNELALKASVNSLRKNTTKLIESMREKLLSLIASIEVNIDYPEYDDAIVMTEEIILPAIIELKAEMNNVLEHSKIAVMAVHGVKTAIVGRPNVGKSSLLNMMLDEEKAIVTDIAGTTRDVIEGSLTLGNVTLNLIDTAGIRHTTDEVERIGIERSKKALEKAELVLLVLDGSKPLENDDYELLELTKNKNRIIVVNKSDLKQNLSLDEKYLTISAKNKFGLKELESELLKITKINNFNVSDNNYLSNTRHIAKVKEALSSLESAIFACNNHYDVDMIEIDIKNAWNLLGDIIGQNSSDLLLDELFSKFCLGK